MTMTINSYVFIITRGNNSLYSYFILSMIIVSSLAFVTWMVDFFSGSIILNEKLEQYVRIIFVASLLLGGICIKIKPPMDFIEGIKVSENLVTIIDENEEITWSEINELVIKYESYKNELKYTLSYVLPQSGYNNTLIIRYNNKTIKFDFYLKSAEEANSLFELASFLKKSGKPLSLEMPNGFFT